MNVRFDFTIIILSLLLCCMPFISTVTETPYATMQCFLNIYNGCKLWHHYIIIVLSRLEGIFAPLETVDYYIFVIPLSECSSLSPQGEM